MRWLYEARRTTKRLCWKEVKPKIVSGNGEIDGKRLGNMPFLNLQRKSFRLMYKLAWQKIETQKTLSHGLLAWRWTSCSEVPKSAKICSPIRRRPWDRCTILDIGSQISAGPIPFLNSFIWFKSSEKPCYQGQIDQSRTVKSKTWVCTFGGNFQQFPLISRPWNF